MKPQVMKAYVMTAVSSWSLTICGWKTNCSKNMPSNQMGEKPSKKPLSIFRLWKNLNLDRTGQKDKSKID
jgi:hypothetical protein